MSFDGIPTGAIVEKLKADADRRSQRDQLARRWYDRLPDTEHRQAASRNAASLVTAYPWMRPSMIAALSSFGFSSMDSVQLAALAANERTNQIGGWTLPGQKIKGEDIARRLRQPGQISAQGIPNAALEQVPGSITSPGLFDPERMAGEPTDPQALTPSGNIFEANGRTFQYVNGRLQFTSGGRAGRPTSPPTSMESYGFDPNNFQDVQTYQQLVQSGQLSNIAIQRDAILEGGLLVDGEIPVPGGNFPVRDIVSLYNNLPPSTKEEWLARLDEHALSLIDQYAPEGSTSEEESRWDAASYRAPYADARILRGIDQLRTALAAPGLEQAQSAGFTGAVVGAVGEAAKDAIRITSTMLDTIPQEIQHSYRAIRNSLTGTGGGAANNTTIGRMLTGQVPFQGAESDFGIATERALGIGTGSPQGLSAYNFGNGFFRGNNTDIAMERYHRELQHGTTNGHVITMGRDFADILPVTPNTTPYNVASGLVDMIPYMIDPGGLIFDAGISGLRSMRLLARTRSVAPHIADDVLRSDPMARRLIQYFADDVNEVRRVVGDVDVDGVVTNLRSVSDGRIAEAWVETGRSIRPDIFMELAMGAPGDYNYVENVLRSHLGVGISANGVHLPGRSSQAFSRVLGQHRLGQMMPAPSLGEGPQEIVQNIERWARNFNASDEITYSLMERAMAAFTIRGREVDDLGEIIARGSIPIPKDNDLYDIWSDLLGHAGEHLVRSGVPEQVAREYTEGFIREVGNSGLFWLDENGRGNELWHAMVNGDPVALPGPQLFAEYLSTNLPLPDARRIRRLASSKTMHAIMANENLPESVRGAIQTLGGFSLAHKGPNASPGRIFTGGAGDQRAMTALLEWGMNDVWKPMTLLRLAWPIRVIAEEQMRLAAEGMASAFHHPLSYLAWTIGHKGDGSALLETWDENVDAFVRSQSIGTGGWAGSPEEGIRNNRWKVFDRADDGRPRAYAFEITKLSNDPIAREIAAIEANLPGRRYATLDDLIAAGEEGGALHPARMRMAHARNRESLLTRRLPGSDTFPARFADPDVVATIDSWDDLVESIALRVHDATSAGDSRILDAIANGRVVDPATGDVVVNLRNNTRAIDDFGAFIRKNEDWNELGPDRLPGLGRFTDRTPRPEIGEMADGVVGWLFSHLMSKPTNYLSRSPAFRQYYWKRIEELIPYLDDADRVTLLANAERSLSAHIPIVDLDIPTADLRRIRAAANSPAGGDAVLNLDDIDELAKGHALDQTRWLLYDLAEKSQFFDQFNLFFPFGEAWKEVITRWGQLLGRHPHAFRKPVLITQELSQNDVLPHPPDEQGFFWTNENGEEVFIYPGSGWVNDQLIGIPVPFTGRVQGLSLATEIFPGLGPVLQIPLSHIVPDKPSWDGIREIIFPFGAQGSYESLIPPGMRRAAQAINRWLGNGETLATSPQSDSAWANTVVDVLRYGVSSGDINFNSEADMRHALEWATSRATQFYAIRAVAQLAGPFPAAPSPEWVVESADGQVMMAQALISEYQTLVQADPRTASQVFLRRYGTNLYPLLQGKTVSNSIDIPVTVDGDNWVRDHPDIVDRFPYVYGLFAPRTGAFDFAAWERGIRRGDRISVDNLGGTTEQGLENWIMLANDSRASQLYYAERDRLIEENGPDSAFYVENYLSDTYVPELREEFPGFRDTYHIPQGLSLDQLRNSALDQMREAIDYPELRDLPVSAAIREYLQAHDEGMELALARGEAETYYTADSMADYRAYLRGIVAPRLIEETPEFAPVFERYFSRLMESEEG